MSEQHDSTSNAGSEDELFDDPEQLSEDDLAAPEEDDAGETALAKAQAEIDTLNLKTPAAGQSAKRPTPAGTPFQVSPAISSASSIISSAPCALRATAKMHRSRILSTACA